MGSTQNQLFEEVVCCWARWQSRVKVNHTLLQFFYRYQSNLNDLRTKGFIQIEKYVKTTPQIKPTIEQQLNNVQESYNSLLHTAKQIKSRLDESLEKFLEYERTLESIMVNLNEYEASLGTDFQPSDDINEAKKQVEHHKVSSVMKLMFDLRIMRTSSHTI